MFNELKALAETLHYYSVMEVRDRSTHDAYFRHGFTPHVVGVAFFKVWILYPLEV